MKIMSLHTATFTRSSMMEFPVSLFPLLVEEELYEEEDFYAPTADDDGFEYEFQLDENFTIEDFEALLQETFPGIQRFDPDAFIS